MALRVVTFFHFSNSGGNKKGLGYCSRSGSKSQHSYLAGDHRRGCRTEDGLVVGKQASKAKTCFTGMKPFNLGTTTQPCHRTTIVLHTEL